MCSHYQSVKERERFIRQFGVEPPHDAVKTDLWPGYTGPFIRRHPQANVSHEAMPTQEAPLGLFGLVPHWSPDTKITRFTYNARSETVASKPSFREAWKRGLHCIIPAEAIFEADWRSGKPIPTRIARTDGKPMGIAGLWSSWKSPQGDIAYSYTMLTVSATDHTLMRQFNQPKDEKRMVVILPDDQYDNWLQASPAQSMAFLRRYPAAALQAVQANAVNSTLFS